MELYFEMYSGIAGDMTVGALLDLGASRKVLEEGLASMDFGDYELHFGRTVKNEISAFDFDTSFDVQKAREKGPYSLEEVFDIIDGGSFSDRVKNDAKEIFSIVRTAEAGAKGVPEESYEFHPVTIVDSFIDIVGTALLLEDLDPETIYFSDLHEAKGCQPRKRGPMPLPEPAVIQIIEEYELPLCLIDDEGERNTLTGAAIVAYYNTGAELGRFSIKKTGVGAGNSDFKKTTNVLRIMEVEKL